MRDNLSYYPRLMSREQGDWSVDLVRCPHDIGLATEQLIALHRERSEWSRGPRHQDHIPGPREAFFVSRWFQRLSLRGEVTLGRLFIRGELAAVQAFVERAGSLNVYYSGQAERWRRYSPLTIVIAEALRDAVRRGVRRLVFPPGSDPWGPLRSTPVHETSVYSTSLPSLVRGVLRRAHLSTGTLDRVRAGSEAERGSRFEAGPLPWRHDDECIVGLEGRWSGSTLPIATASSVSGA